MSTKIKFSIVVIFMAFNIISAQYGNQGMNGGMQRGAGMQNNGSDRYSKSPEDLQKEREENIAKTLEKLKTDLNLDALQEIAVKNEITANFKTMDIILKSESSQDEKIAKIESASERMDQNIISYLNPEQKEKYKKHIEERAEKMERFKGKYH